MTKKRNLLWQSALVAVVLSVLFIFIKDAHGQKQAVEEILTRQQQEVQISSFVQQQSTCSNGDLKLKFLITVKNLKEMPTVFCKSCFGVTGLFVGKNIESLYKNDFVYDLQSFGHGQAKYDTPDPNKTPFITLKKGETFSTFIDADFDNLEDEDTLVKSPALKSGEYAFMQVIRTFTESGDLNLGATLKEKWAKEGLYFWTKDIITNPTYIKIENGKKQRCE